MRALTDWGEYRKDDAGNYIPETDPVRRQRLGEYRQFVLWYRGQYVDRDNPIVKKHPANFEAIL